MEDINLLLTYIETEIAEGKRSLLGGGVIVSGETILNLTSRLREAVKEATGADVVTNANNKAQQIIAMAEARRAQILDNDTVIADARAIAEKIKNDAINQRIKAGQEFNTQLYNLLEKVHTDLSSAAEQVESSMEYFAEKSDS